MCILFLFLKAMYSNTAQTTSSQRPYGVLATFAQRPYSVQNALTALKKLLWSAHTALTPCV